MAQLAKAGRYGTHEIAMDTGNCARCGANGLDILDGFQPMACSKADAKLGTADLAGDELQAQQPSKAKREVVERAAGAIRDLLAPGHQVNEMDRACARAVIAIVAP